MTEMGKAMMGTGEAEGASRALEAAEAAISNPLLDEISMKGARGVLINITGGPDMTLFEVDETANRIRDEVDPEANIIFGSTFDKNLEGRIRVSVVATGIDSAEAAQPHPAGLSLVSALADRGTPQPEAGAETRAIAAVAAAPAAAESPVQAPLMAPAEAPAMPAQAQARNSLYAYSQAVALGTTAEPAPAAKTSTAVAESMAAETLAVGTSRVALAPAAPEADMTGPVADRFIAPPPAEPEPAPEPEIRTPARAQADPFATAALENGSRAPREAEPAAVKAPEPRRIPGFFAKMTGGASRAIQAATQGATQGGEQRSPRAGVSAQGPAQPAAPPRAGAEPKLRASAGPAARAAEPRLSGFESAGPESASQADEDLLDIPAFLRRQAN
jgi:cell division protein FtsZ